jgi:hypothetical protein
MAVEHADFLVEEESMRRTLLVLLPRLLPNVTFSVYAHGGKQALLRKLPSRLCGYRGFLTPRRVVFVICDADQEDCRALKRRLAELAEELGFDKLQTRNRRAAAVCIRIAVQELEAWFFGDWQAVRTAYPKLPAAIPATRGYRDPDAIANTWESLERIMKAHGYFTTGLRKIEAAQAIAAGMDPAVNRSRSFQAFRDAVIAVAAA